VSFSGEQRVSGEQLHVWSRSEVYVCKGRFSCRLEGWRTTSWREDDELEGEKAMKGGQEEELCSKQRQ
jgi:hypothetical protein